MSTVALRLLVLVLSCVRVPRPTAADATTPACDAALRSACSTDAARAHSPFAQPSCATCAGHHQRELKVAGCAHDAIQRYCAGDTLLEQDFCQKYYPAELVQRDGYPACADVKAEVTSNLTRPLPTLELGDASRPGMVFVHGWPDSAAEWAPQFAHFCYTGRYRCVAVTWQNFHPDLPDAPTAELEFATTLQRLAATIRDAGLHDTTLVIHDWGSFLGYQFMHLYPDLMERVVSFDIGSGGHPNTTYQSVNQQAWAAKDSAPAQSSAAYWCAPCIDCAVWRTVWPYVSSLSMRELTPCGSGPCPGPPQEIPLLFLWGNTTCGKPRTSLSKFFDQSWLDFVETTPHGRVVETPGDHWMHVRAAKFSNDAIDTWLSEQAAAGAAFAQSIL